MNALANLKELASSVARAKGSATATPGRDARAEGSAAAYVDEQIALLVDTIEAEARRRRASDRNGAAEGQSATTAGRKRPHSVRSSSSRVAAPLFRRFLKWRQQIFLYGGQQIFLYGAIILLGLAVVLAGTLAGR